MFCTCSRRCLLVSSVLTVLVVGALVAVLVLQPWVDQQPRYPRAAVAANGYECASIGRQILERKGSAVDAAIATLFCEGIACAQCMGLGGGFLATVYDAQTRRVRVLNARERAPAATTPDMFDKASTTVGGLAIAVPGELRGYGALHQEYGRLPWADLVRPTADLCRHGHRVNQYMGRVLKSYSDRIYNESSMSELYVNPATGLVWNEGDLIREPTLARTLDIIAREGPEAIHNGSLTAALVQDIQNFGGIITEDDLRNYKVEWQEPIEVPLTSKHTLYSVPLPGSGSVLAFMLNMMNGWIGVGTDVPVGSNLYWHRVVETFKYAYAKRTALGDPSRSNLSYNISEVERNLSDPAWARSFRSRVDDARTYSDWKHYGALFEGADDHGTAHVVVVAPDGSVVSATSTINYIWGSQRRSKSLGIMLNNEMDDFAIHSHASAYGMPPSPANMLAPGLQPLSSMVPSVVLSKDGTADLVIGAAGGTKITTQVALVAMHRILEGDELFDVIDRPRLHHQLMPMEIEFETNFSPWASTARSIRIAPIGTSSVPFRSESVAGDRYRKCVEISVPRETVVNVQGIPQSVISSLTARGHASTERGPTAGFAAMVGAARDGAGLIAVHTDRRRVGSVDGF